MLSHLAGRIAAGAAARAGRFREDADPAGPWGVYPCDGDDQWCVVTVRDEEDLAALASVLGHQELDREDAERELVDWLAGRGPREAMETLQAAKIPAGAMLRVAELPDFDYFRARAVFRTEQHPRLDGALIAERMPTTSRRLPEPPRMPAPVAGEHTVEIARERLGLSPEEVRSLLAVGVLEDAAAFGIQEEEA